MKNYNPYANGRWYKFFIESDGSNVTLTTSDIEEATISNTSLLLPLGYHICSLFCDFNTISSTSEINLPVVKASTNAKQYISLPDLTNYDYATIYLFCKTHPTGDGVEVKEEVKEVKKTRKTKE